MMINQILYDLNQLEKNMAQIKADVYSNLGLVDNNSVTNRELEKKLRYEFSQFENRIVDLRIELVNTKGKVK